MFQFNFQIEENQSNTNERQQIDDDEQSDSIDHECGCLTLDEIPMNDTNSNEFYRKKYDLDRSDLLPNVYEGGFKTWECSLDLVDYLKVRKEDFTEQTTVLEIGCGSGLPGMELNKSERFQVDFQDFNREVIEQTGRQLKTEQISSNNRLYFGDWKDLIGILPSKFYDLLLTSETIYNTSNYGKLVRLFDHCLKSNGIIYLAAKVYYFGVQGGTRQFEEYLTKTSRFKSRVIRVIDANVKREILEIRRIDS